MYHPVGLELDHLRSSYFSFRAFYLIKHKKHYYIANAEISRTNYKNQTGKINTVLLLLQHENCHKPKPHTQISSFYLSTAKRTSSTRAVLDGFSETSTAEKTWDQITLDTTFALGFQEELKLPLPEVRL